MPELRWILIGAGLLLLVGLWWWESRRQATAATPVLPPSADPAERAATQLGEGVLPEAAPATDLPAIRASRRERGVAGRNPPVIEIPEDAEPELARPTDDNPPTRIPYRSMQERLDEMPEDLRNLPRDEKMEAEQRQPWVRTQPMDRDLVMGRSGNGDSEADPRPDEPDEPAAPAAGQQRIIALRLLSDGERWTGRAVVEALEAEGMVFGKYSIYHRERDDGKSIFFVASMVEPGSFDLDAIDTLNFPGISIFAVVPGPVEAPATFDMMLSTARRLADRLSGRLQDEQGSTLTAQRILNLREELVHFEHLARRVQRR
jgi:cell division protein ZipA